MGLASMFLGDQNPFSQWVGGHQNFLNTIGSGLMQGQNLQHGLQIAGQNAPQARQLDLQQAEKMKAEALAKSQANYTIKMFRDKGFNDLADMAEAGAPMPTLMGEYFKRIQPGEPIKGVEVNGRLVNPYDGTVLADFSQPAERSNADILNDKTVDVSSPQFIQAWAAENQSRKGDMRGFRAPIYPGQVGSFQPMTPLSAGNPALSPVPLAQQTNTFAAPTLKNSQGSPSPLTPTSFTDGFGAVLPAPQGDAPDMFAREKDLAAQYSGQEPLKTYREVRNGYERVRSSAMQASGQGDVGLVYGYMKMLDPGSVVREGEFATAEQTSGAAQQFVGLYNKLLNGERLTDEQRQGFVKAADALYQEAMSNLKDLNSQFTKRATTWGVNPENIIVTPEQYQALVLGGATRINSQEEFDKLPSGAEFIGPDGVPRRKP